MQTELAVMLIPVLGLIVTAGVGPQFDTAWAVSAKCHTGCHYSISRGYPSRLSEFMLLNGVYDVKIVGALAYVADGYNGLVVVDVSDPQNLEVAGQIDTPGDAKMVYVVGKTVFLADWNGGLVIIDVGDHRSPRIIGQSDTPGDANSVYVADDIAYVADWSGGLVIVDVSVLQVPRIVGQVGTPGGASGVYVVGDQAYVSDWSGGLVICDVHDPKVPRIRGLLDTPGQARAVQVVGNHAFLADGKEGLVVIDVSEGQSPRTIVEVDTLGEAIGLYVLDGRVYVANGRSGLLVVDVSKPEEARIFGQCKTGGTAHSVFVVGDEAYVASGANGLVVCDLTALAPTPTRTRTSTITATPSRTPTPSTTATPSFTPNRVGTAVAATLTALALPPSSGSSSWLPFLGRQDVLRFPPPAPPATSIPTPEATDSPKPTPIVCAIAEREPNTFPEDAVGQPILCPGQPIRGALTLVDDPPNPQGRADRRGDYYTLLIDRQLTARVRLDPSGIKANVDFDLNVYSCPPAACSRVAFSGKRGRAVDEVTVLLAAGQYFVSVEPVTDSRSDETYELGWEIVP